MTITIFPDFSLLVGDSRVTLTLKAVPMHPFDIILMSQGEVLSLGADK